MKRLRQAASRETLTLWAIPLVILVLSQITVRMAGGFVPDPSYGYLFNGLEILDFHPPSYFDHPGTTLEILAAIVIFFTWLVRLPFEFAGVLTSVFLHPELHLRVINAVLVAALGVAIFHFGRRLRELTGSLAPAMAGQVVILICFPATITLNSVMPEPLLLASGVVLMTLLAPFVFGQETNPARAAKFIGIVFGFTVATKFTAIPLAAAILLLPDRPLQKRAAMFAAGGFIFFTLPTAHHYPQMLVWILKLATHQGGYGQGAVGVPPLSTLWENGNGFLAQAPEIFFAAMLCAVAFLLCRSRTRRLFAVSFLVLAIQILLCLKAQQVRYLLPVVSMMALAASGLFHDVLAMPARRIALAGRLALGALFAAGLGHNIRATAVWAREVQEVDRENQELLRQAAAQCALVPYYTARLPIYNLTFGNEFTNNHFGPALRAQFPNAVTYDIARKQFSAFGDAVAVTDVKARLAHAGCVRMVGSPVARFTGVFGIAPQMLSLVGRSGHGIDAMTVYDYRLFSSEH